MTAYKSVWLVASQGFRAWPLGQTLHVLFGLVGFRASVVVDDQFYPVRVLGRGCFPSDFCRIRERRTKLQVAIHGLAYTLSPETPNPRNPQNPKPLNPKP